MPNPLKSQVLNEAFLINFYVTTWWISEHGGELQKCHQVYSTWRYRSSDNLEMNMGVSCFMLTIDFPLEKMSEERSYIIHWICNAPNLLASCNNFYLTLTAAWSLRGPTYNWIEISEKPRTTGRGVSFTRPAFAPLVLVYTWRQITRCSRKTSTPYHPTILVPTLENARYWQDPRNIFNHDMLLHSPLLLLHHLGFFF